MNLHQRKEILIRLGRFMDSDDGLWQAIKHKASISNPWFTPDFIDLAANNIVQQYLEPAQVEKLISRYNIPENDQHKTIGIVMAGNIPMVGFHDLLCVFLSGHHARIKVSSKDDVLIPFLVKKMIEWAPEAASYLTISDLLKGCDAYIATGSGNSAVHFEYYFRNHPKIIRKNRTSVAVLTGEETPEQLNQLADDVHIFFGLGCRNVTKIYVPHGYDFVPLLKAFEKYHHLVNFNKYKNNFEYNLALHILNKREYMTNGSILLVEDNSVFSPISQLHYEYYSDAEMLKQELRNSEQVQAVLSKSDLPFGQSQCPDICNFADGVDTMEFLLALNEK